MKLIQDNPFRIAGILANSSEKELQKQKSKITKYASIGKELDFELDFSFLGKADRSVDSLNKAFSGIEQNQDKVFHSLFWFINANQFDDIAFKYLIADDKEKAIEQWDKVTNGKEITSRNFSCFNNLGTLKLLGTTQKDIKEGLHFKLRLIKSEYFGDFIHFVADETVNKNNQNYIEKFIDNFLIEFKEKYSNKQLQKLFKDGDESTQKYLSEKLIEEPLHKIEHELEVTKNKRKQNKNKAYEFGLRLFTNTKEEVSFLESMLGKNDLKYKSLADKLANEIMQCAIDFFKENQGNSSNNEYLESAQSLIRLADSVAVGHLAKDRAKDSLATLAEMKDQEINQAIALLNSIKDAYTNNERKIILLVHEQKKTLSYGESINWIKVNDTIRNSIDWGKAVELILDAIPRINITKIKNVKDTNKASEYKKLVEFVLDKVNYANKNKIQYLKYWQTTQGTSPTPSGGPDRPAPSPVTEPSWIEENPGCLIFIIIFAIMIVVSILN